MCNIPSDCPSVPGDAPHSMTDRNPTDPQPKSGNFFFPRPLPGSAEAVETLCTSGQVRIERIASHGHASPPGFWYDQTEDEWVMLLQGAAVLGFDDGRELALHPGTWVALPAHCRHRVVATAPDTLWLAVFAPADADPAP